MTARYARVVVDVAPAHLDKPFDYRIPDGASAALGQRVRVVFAGRRRDGWVVDTTDAPDTDPERIRALDAVLGNVTWFDEADLELYRWVADRYAGTLADVLRHALPARVAAVEAEVAQWDEPSAGPAPAARPPCPTSAWRPYAASPLLNAAAATGRADPAPAFWLRVLPGDDRAALAADLVGRALWAGRGALVLVPDPASALADAALRSAGGAGVELRGEDRRDRYRAFLRGRAGHARVVVGERGAVLAPVQDLGLVVVDDEANPAYKERRSPRHHARDVALARARMAGATAVVLGDLPSANLWRLLRDGHVQVVASDRGEERRRAPRIDVADLGDPRPGARRARFGDAATRALSQVVRDGGNAVVLTSRGGQGGALACRRCRRRRTCPRCDGSLGVDRAAESTWRCAACGWSGEPLRCPSCGDTTASPLAAGAGRLAAELARSYPAADVVRMEGFDAAGPDRRPGIGVMTRGSVVTRPRWLRGRPADLLVLPDADAMLGRPSLDAAEDALRLWFAAAGWAHRVIVQTRESQHPAVQALVRWDPEGFWRREAPWRHELRFPPDTSIVRLTAPDADAAAEVATTLRGVLPRADEVLGPDLAGAILVKTSQLRGTLRALTPVRHDWARHDRRVRIDVDPVL